MQGDSRILGDVDNNGRVDLLDALLVAVYYGNPLVELPNGGYIGLGDVNADGSVDLTDAYLIGQYSFNPVDPALPPGIGRPATVASGFGSGGKEMVVSLGEGVEMEFVWIEPGVFQMGSPDSESGRGSDEGPVHEVQISKGFWLGKYEVTQGQWEAVMGRNPSEYTGDDRRPVEQISWNDVQDFIARLNAAEAAVYRLPTEAEWEYACRAGSTTRWSFGDNESLLGDYAWYSGNNSPSGTKAVGGKLPNAWGLYDMHGNVWEWVRDRYDSGYYNSSPRVDPLGPDTGSDRVRRGGYFGDNRPVNLRSAYRYYDSPGDRYRGIGVRLVRVR